MAPTTRAGARRALFVDKSLAPELSDACSRTNEDNARAIRKRKRSREQFSFVYEEDSRKKRIMALFSIMFLATLFVVTCMFTYMEEKEEDDDASTHDIEDDVSTDNEEVEDDDLSSDNKEQDGVSTDKEEELEDGTYLDADLLKSALGCLKAMKGRIDRDLGPENVICEEVLDSLEGEWDTGQEELLSARDIFASKNSKFRSLMELPKDLRWRWLLVHARKL